MRKKGFDLFKEWILLPRDVQRELEKAIEESTGEDVDEFAWGMLVGPCPKCGYPKTMDCEGIEGIDDPTVGLCKGCGFLWCTECGSALGASSDCGHWEVCESCQTAKDAEEECEYSPDECEIIQNWKFPRGHRESESTRYNK